MNGHSIFFLFLISNLLFFSQIIPQTFNVTSPADSGGGTLRQAITDINAGSDTSNTINLRIPGNSPISVGSDLPVIKKNTTINSTGEQPINGQGQYRLFATIMADLSLTNCNLHNGAAIGGNGGGGGMGAGGGVYIDRGKTLTLTNSTIISCKAKGGQSRTGTVGGGGASFSSSNKHATGLNGGGDYPGLKDGSGGSYDGSTFLTGYGGGNGGTASPGSGGGNGSGQDGVPLKGGNGGYCGGGGGRRRQYGFGGGGGGGGNGGGKGLEGEGGGGGFGSGGAYAFGGGGFGGGGADFAGGGGFGGGGAFDGESKGEGGRYGGKGGGGGAGIGGAIFVGDTATCIIQDNVSISGNTVQGGKRGVDGEPGQGYAPDIFLFREAKVIFDNQQPLAAPYSIMADQEAPAGHLDKGIIKQGPGQLTLSNPNNNYRGGTRLEGGTLSVSDPKALGSSTAPITLDGGTLQPTKTMTLSQPIAVNGDSGIDTPGNTTLTTTGNVSGSGAIDKTGTGTWRETGTSTHTGNINVNGGAFQVDGTVPSNINVNPGGTLQGTGLAGGNVTNSGTVSPGDNNIGTLTIGGNYTQTPDGLLQLQMRPRGQSDYLNVNGTANIAGAVDFHLQPGIYPKNQSYDLIHANGGLAFNPEQITSNSRFAAQLQITPTT